ncbi:MAG TPA: hypothetical protein VI032_02030 [Burkholderiaceae bacterium]
MSSYLLPFDTVFNLWWTAVPVYDMEPVAPPVVPPEGQPKPQATGADDLAASAAAADASESSDDDKASEQSMRLVFKGVKWIPVSAYNIRENLYYNLLQENQREADEQRSLARKPLPPRPQLRLEDQPGPDETSAKPTDAPSED